MGTRLGMAGLLLLAGWLAAHLPGTDARAEETCTAASCHMGLVEPRGQNHGALEQCHQRC